MTLILLTALLSTPQGTESPNPVLSRGDAARIESVFRKAKGGQPITVAVIGGSITQGTGASSESNRYANRVGDWFGKTFPKSKVTFLNAGIGATGSYYGALRARRDLLSHHPDFVLVDFGVNDPNERFSAETTEGLVRGILAEPNRPAVALIFFMSSGGKNAQEWLGKVGTHYGLPMISFRDALWPEIEAKRLRWEDVEADGIHPNDRGHELAAKFVTDYLESVLRQTKEGAGRSKPLPKPLISDRFAHTRLLDGPKLAPIRNEGWSLDEDETSWMAKTYGKSWVAKTPGSVLEATVRGAHIAVMSWRTRGPMGRIRVQVDDGPPRVVDGWFKETWGGYVVTTTVADGLPDRDHRVSIELLEDRAPESTGYGFKLFALGSAR